MSPDHPGNYRAVDATHILAAQLRKRRSGAFKCLSSVQLLLVGRARSLEWVNYETCVVCLEDSPHQSRMTEDQAAGTEPCSFCAALNQTMCWQYMIQHCLADLVA